MSVQRPHKLASINVFAAPVRCLCDKEPKGYIHDNNRFHVECLPCRVITPRFKSMTTATSEFVRMCDAVRYETVSPMHLIRSAK